MIRRIFKTGNSIVVSLPKEVLDELGIKDGESVNLELDREQHRVIITPVEKPIAIEGDNEELARQVDEFIQQYRPALNSTGKVNLSNFIDRTLAMTHFLTPEQVLFIHSRITNETGGEHGVRDLGCRFPP